MVNPAVIEALGGLDDCIKPIEESLKKHEMRPFDIEPNYYDDLVQSRHFLQELAENSRKGRMTDNNVLFEPNKSEFLKRTMSDASYQNMNSKIVSASPFRAIVRKVDPPFDMNQTTEET